VQNDFGPRDVRDYSGFSPRLWHAIKL
jgi:hypothetical protein